MDGAETRGYGDKIIVVTDDGFSSFIRLDKYDPFKDGKVERCFFVAWRYTPIYC